MNQLPNHPKIGSLLGKRRPVIKLSPNFRSLAGDACERTPMDESKILPWSKFTFNNIVNAYGDVLEQAVSSKPPDEVPEIDCENHCMMVQICYKSFHIPTAISSAISLGKYILRPRLGTDTNLACAEARELSERLPKHAQRLDFGDEDHVQVFYDPNPNSWHPFLATSLTVPSCTWKSGSLVTANRDKQPKLGPIEQLAACAKKTNTCFSFILGDKDIVVLQFFKTETGGMGVY
ncbi:hypothetical protein BFJ70_g9648 [Fusarium oxysporum]|nr:hypothetical protein BFJ70_g9648 [Fusarium oxysporum]